MFVSTEEQQVLNFLKSSPEAWFSAAEICRKAADTRQYRENPRWALRSITSLRDKRLIESDEGGHYRHVQSPDD